LHVICFKLLDAGEKYLQDAMRIKSQEGKDEPHEATEALDLFTRIDIKIKVTQAPLMSPEMTTILAKNYHNLG
jgi:hypothetical protein